jgi:uncharacterized membrane protein HdeD (DUF308 family)
MLRSDLLGGNTWPWWAQALRGVILVLAGIAALFQPGAALIGLATAIGLGLLFAGVMACVTAVTLRRTAAPWGVMLVAGIFEAVIGVMVLSRPILSAEAIPLVTALWAMVAGISLFVGGMATNRIPLMNGTVAMAGGAVLVLLGWLILANPPLGAMTIITLIGAALIASGAASLAGAYAMYRLRNRAMPVVASERVEEHEPPRKAA